MIDDLMEELRGRMGKSVDALQEELLGIRTGRASPALVERLQVEYYGTLTPLNQMASVAVPEPLRVRQRSARRRRSSLSSGGPCHASSPPSAALLAANGGSARRRLGRGGTGLGAGAGGGGGLRR